MKNYLKLSLLILILVNFVHAREHSNSKNQRARSIMGTPVQSILDINNMTTWVRDDGFF